jgi:uncharacterized protein
MQKMYAINIQLYAINIHMGTLAKILSSQVRAEIFRLLFNQKMTSLHVRELQRKSGFAIRTIQKEIQTLKELDLVIGRRDGNRLYYSANPEHPLFGNISDLVEKTDGVIENLKIQLLKIGDIDCAFVFGSFAKGMEKAHSDIDLIIIGTTSLRQISTKLKNISEKIEREINPHVYSKRNWQEKLKKKDHFVKSVMAEQKIFLVGDMNVIK